MLTLIKDGYIFDSEKGDFFKGDILVKDHKIERVGEKLVVDKVDKVIDAEGKNVLPGFIDAHSHIGMWTNTQNGNDANECTEPATQTMRAIDGINPFDPCFGEAIEVGITTVMTPPGSGNVIGGQVAILKTKGNSVDEMVINKYAALKVAFGENPKNVYGSIGKSPSSRMSTAKVLDETLYKASLYLKEREKEKVKVDYDLEPFVPVLKKEIPIKIHAHRADDILTGIRIAEKYNLKYTLDHCTEGIKIVDQLKNKNCPILLGPLLMFKSKSELKDGNIETAKVLSDAGCNVSIISDHPFANAKYLLTSIGILVKNGLDYIEALKMVTINPARALEIDDRVGIIKEGKDADIVIYDGNPLELQSKVCVTMINGEIEYTTNY